MDLSAFQLEKISELFLDLAKGLFLASVAVPVVTPEATLLDSIRTTLVGIFLTYLSLKIVRLKEIKQ